MYQQIYIYIYIYIYLFIHTYTQTSSDPRICGATDACLSASAHRAARRSRPSRPQGCDSLHTQTSSDPRICGSTNANLSAPAHRGARVQMSWWHSECSWAYIH